MAPAANTAMADKEVIIRFMGSLLFCFLLLNWDCQPFYKPVFTHSLAKSREEEVR